MEQVRATVMQYSLHSTKKYYQQEITSLGWELTVCNSLQQRNSVCRSILKCQDSYGNLLYSFLEQTLPMERISAIMEVGGGYGFLMKDFLTRNPSRRAIMVDISPLLLNMQREILKRFELKFLETDFLDMDGTVFSGIDLIIMNENIGDFPTIYDLTLKQIPEVPGKTSGPLDMVARLHNTYALRLPDSISFSFNLGALLAIEKICLARIPFVIITEHSCEARVPPEFGRLVQVDSPGTPMRISLKGHEEYTVKFSYLENIARTLGYCVVRGPLADILQPCFSERLSAILSGPVPLSNGQEVLRHFVSDLFLYEYLILKKV
jgi:hypothetical protein